MKKFFTLLSIFTLSLTSASVHANTVTVDGATGLTSQYLPVALHTNTSNANYAFHSVSQQLYYASELAGASSNNITAISFDYVGTTMTDRKIAVLMNSVSYSSFPLPNEENLEDAANKTPNMVNPGKRVFSGQVAMVDGERYTITFDTPYEWDGTSNIVVTVLDSTAKKNSSITYYPDATIYTVAVRIFETSGKVRFLHKTSKDNSDYASKGWDMNDLAASKANSSSVDNRKYANRITFTFAAPAAVAPSTPEDLAATNVGSTTASLSWTVVDGATSYKLYHSTSAEGLYTEFASPATNSYNWTGLTASTTYYVKVSAVNGVGESALSELISFTTQAPHIHDGITFEPWSNASAMPTSGNYYLETDVELAGSSNVTLSGNLNLCLNGHIILTSSNCIIVPDAVTFAIYDNEGTGVIRGAFPGDFANSGLISIKAGGTLSISEGGVVNLADDADDYNCAIDNKGTLNLSGAPTISGIKADIYLASGKVITLVDELTNATPYSVNAVGQTITSGWSNMGEANPANYFTSAKTGYPLVKLVDGEAKLVSVITLSEGSDNSTAITDKDGIESDIRLTRSLTSAQYNTFCLPFALSDAQLQEAFGAGYDLQEFVSSDLVDETLELNFNKVYALEAGKPYLLKPSADVVNPIFPNVTITATSPVNQMSDIYISFYGIYSPTELEGGNQNILFLGAENELFWPDSDGDLKGFRAYFEVKSGVSKIAKRARIVNKEDAATNLDKIQGNNVQRTKYIENGQLFILYNGTKYNVQGQVIK